MPASHRVQVFRRLSSISLALSPCLSFAVLSVSEKASECTPNTSGLRSGIDSARHREHRARFDRSFARGGRSPDRRGKGQTREGRRGVSTTLLTLFCLVQTKLHKLYQSPHGHHRHRGGLGRGVVTAGGEAGPGARVCVCWGHTRCPVPLLSGRHWTRATKKAKKAKQPLRVQTGGTSDRASERPIKRRDRSRMPWPCMIQIMMFPTGRQKPPRHTGERGRMVRDKCFPPSNDSIDVTRSRSLLRLLR